jgi:hypothetical protein
MKAIARGKPRPESAAALRSKANKTRSKLQQSKITPPPALPKSSTEQKAAPHAFVNNAG